MQNNPTWYIWAGCCIWMLAPVLVAFLFYRFLLVTAIRRPTITKTSVKKNGRNITVWELDIAERTSIIRRDEEDDKNDEDENNE
jgi:hypothetical protein